MSYLRTIKIRNGDDWEDFIIYKCDKCGEEIKESDPRCCDGSIDYCWECGFRLGLLTDTEFLKMHGFAIEAHAAINPITDKIHIWLGKNKIPIWERGDKKIRHSPEYTQWRAKVFERDNYICQDCTQRGGVLNAHHIKSFVKHKKLRFIISNGITLCDKCHKGKHKKRVID